MSVSKVVATLAAAVSAVSAVSIAEINGKTFLSPLQGQSVTDVEGLVTAINQNGIFLRSTDPDDDPATSEGLFVYGSTVRPLVAVGDIITLDGKVSEYRSNNLYPYLTQLQSPTNVKVQSSDNEVKPWVIGVDTPSPPTEKYSSLDEGDVFGVPNDVARLSTANPELDIETYGLDFWESLVGQLLTIKDAYQIGRPNQYGDVWVRGDWNVTGLNDHGGLTVLDGPDANPEAIIIGSPTDGSSNPDDTKMGDFLGDITGLVYQAFGFYRILPLTAVATVNESSSEYDAVSFESDKTCRGLTFANYNARNLAPDSKLMPATAAQIVDKMLTPDVIFLQEVLDNSGETDDGVVSGNLTLSTLSAEIEKQSGVVYDFLEISPKDKQDGGVPGGNIRVAYLYRPESVEPMDLNPGGVDDANEVLAGPTLKYNPGLIDPTNAAWSDSRKPLAAQWKAVKGNGRPFFTVNVHFGSKGGSSTLHGDPRPPINNGVEKRNEQATITAEFIADILAENPAAAVIIAGDFNEFVQVKPIQTFQEISGMLDLEDVVDMEPVERYTYLFDANSQALDHMFISPSVGRKAQYEHLHLNTWQNYDDQVSDHDPSVAKLNVCGCGPA
ncbi:Endonuclease/exonuclease/phosphatase [Emericellopsis atlantica]|uniref:Endonuclease/exonuclease/phosphatase n=1 Tax=Emericellopsis atlantica TaxID=2614577 RepID=A0A9P8CKK2_9HYPO|nr:Endonuclease/exonuclease/phosphatase [Emericellopsis atlantica]KAG9250453.1 Endonuclease/exonuclease/phosphatase [Emericellopsis atlantica]